MRRIGRLPKPVVTTAVLATTLAFVTPALLEAKFRETSNNLPTNVGSALIEERKGLMME